MPRPLMSVLVLGQVDHGRTVIVDCLVTSESMSLERVKIGQELGVPNHLNLKTYTIDDVSGHRQFVQNLIVSGHRYDVALLVISAIPSEFQEAWAGIARQQVLLTQACGIRNLIVTITKAGSTQTFREIKSIIQADITSPITFTHGPRGIHQALSRIHPVQKSTLPIRFPIQDVFKIGGIGTVIMGRLETGFLQPGIQITRVYKQR
jgi:elongation factor 1-alpha